MYRMIGPLIPRHSHSMPMAILQSAGTAQKDRRDLGCELCFLRIIKKTWTLQCQKSIGNQVPIISRK